MKKKNCPDLFFKPKVAYWKFFLGIILVCIASCTHYEKAIAVTVNETMDTSFGIANYLPIRDEKVEDGDIVSFSPQGYFLSKTQYDSLMIGVVTKNPAISLESIQAKISYPVVSTGNTYVNVTTSNGNIKKGDPITSSSLLGKGTKGTHTGYIIGTALEDYSSTNTKAIKKIAVNLSIHYYASQTSVKTSIFDIFNLSKVATYEEPIQAFKYFVAAIIVILSFVFGFFSFARTATKGLEALGRNPLAGRIIQFGILLNIVVAVIIVLSGLLIAFCVIRL